MTAKFTLRIGLPPPQPRVQPGVPTQRISRYASFVAGASGQILQHLVKAEAEELVEAVRELALTRARALYTRRASGRPNIP